MRLAIKIEYHYDTHFRCTECGETFHPSFHSASYYIGQTPMPEVVAAAELLPIPAQPV